MTKLKIHNDYIKAMIFQGIFRNHSFLKKASKNLFQGIILFQDQKVTWIKVIYQGQEYIQGFSQMEMIYQI